MKKKTTLLTSLILVLLLAISTFAQTPQYYNDNTGASSNTYPFGQAAGQRVHWLIRIGTMIHPTPCPGGNIDTIYFRTSTSATSTFTNLCIKMKSLAITTLPTAWYTTELDTAYFRASVTLTSTLNGWMAIPLDHPILYDTSKGLVIDVQQCGAAPASIYVWQSSGVVGSRDYGSPMACPVSYVGQDGQIINFGVHVSPAVLWSVPELIYYRFHNNGAAVTPNFACVGTAVGTNPAPFTGVTLTSGGQFDTCMLGTGNTGTNGVNTGWNCNLANSQWTISFWVSNLAEVLSGNPVYLWGDPGSTTFRCFYGGFALPNNAIVRGPMPDLIFACPMPGSYVFHVVYNGTTLSIYRNGVFLTSETTSINMPTGSGFRVGGYTGGAYSLNAGGKLDEFRLYNRALTQAEITATWNIELFNCILGINPVTHGIPRLYNLAQNYPNPFNPSTKISYEIPKSGIVRLVVTDVLGREVKTLVNEFKQAGSYSLEFNASNYASGVYFYTIKSGDYMDTKKMVLIK
jgi:hypothetical protein